MSFDASIAAHPEFQLDVACGGGTYIRSIGRDLGLQLGCGALMTRLERLAVGPFAIAEALELDSLTRELCEARLLPVTTALAGIPRVVVDSERIVSIRQGKLQRFEEAPAATRIVLLDEHAEYVAMAEWDAERTGWQPRLVLPAE